MALLETTVRELVGKLARLTWRPVRELARGALWGEWVYCRKHRLVGIDLKLQGRRERNRRLTDKGHSLGTLAMPLCCIIASAGAVAMVARMVTARRP